MLVIARKEGERVFIGDNIAVSVLRRKNNQFAVCIEAPREINIRREELKDKGTTFDRDKDKSARR